MTKILAMGLLLTVAMPMLRATEESFSKAVRAADFSVAGLAKLSPDELARLDALVRDYKSGALLAAKREAEAAEKARAAAEARAAKSAAEAQAANAAASARAAKGEPAQPSESFLTKAKKVLVPAGTQVEVAAIESRLVGEFEGWQGKAIFTLENGQRWQMANAGSYYSPVIKNPAVKISPAALGGFWLTIEGVSQRVKVVQVGGN